MVLRSMKIEHFVKQMRILEAKYGNDKINKSIVNEVWKAFKQYDDEVITKAVSRLMSSKSMYGDKFTLPDFFELQKEEEPSNEAEEIEEDKKSKKKVYMRHQYYKASNRKHSDPQVLKNYLKRLGAKNAVDAMNKIIQKKQTESKD